MQGLTRLILMLHPAGSGGSSGTAPPESWGLAQEAARRKIVQHPDAQRVPRRGCEPWLAPLRDLELLASLHVTSVTVCSGSYVDRLVFQLSDGSQHTIGGTGGHIRTPFVLHAGEHIVELRCREGNALDQIQFVTSEGRRSEKFGDDGGTPIVHSLPGGAPIAGIMGGRMNFLLPVAGLRGLDGAFIRQHGEERCPLHRKRHPTQVVRDSHNGFSVEEVSPYVPLWYRPAVVLVPKIPQKKKVPQKKIAE